jgi:hypothetical protein
MPEKRRVRGCGKSCVSCWKNNLKHGNKLKKKQFPKQNKWHTDESESDTDSNQETLNTYNNYLEEFYNKYIVSNYIHTYKQMSKIDDNNITYRDYNNDLEQYTYYMYIEWLSYEKKNNKKLTFFKFKKNLYNIAKNDFTKYKNFHMYKCIYKDQLIETLQQ